MLMPIARDDSTAVFLDGAARGEFLIKRSRATGEVVGPNVLVDATGATDFEWIPAQGVGQVVSWAVVHPRKQGTDVEVIAIVELAEGPWWWCELVGATADQMREALPVCVDYVRPEDSAEIIPVFRPKV